ncbi:MAG: aconitase family protein, partial [Alphaproteobacteria bacterium]
MSMPRTLFQKIWDSHLVDRQPDGVSLLYIDLHLTHEITSAQAFEGLRINNRKVRRPDLTLAVVDHNVPTTDRSKPVEDEEARIQIDQLDKNAKEFGIEYYDMFDVR